ncbi:MAG: septum formation initiator family protein [Flavobacteriaceae bacterium]|jgi:cell division protein DivIC|nr:septum formation initiator [Flavobacteriaceae bacterium]|tara:strand:+ start:2232 stop:2543 length:312 start_codon:yes stop_codon:yes gene_type:complete
MKKLFKNPWFKLATNLYALIGIFFIVWMVFLDSNSLLIYFNLENKLTELKRQKSTLEENIDLDRQTLLQLSDSTEMERYARERYLMKKSNEDVYLIEYADTIN